MGKSGQEAICEHSIANIEIHIDKHLIKRIQENLVIHSVIENYCRNWPHDKVDELEELIREGLDKLTEARKS